MAKKILTRKEILNVQDRPQEEVHVPEWGEDAYVLVKSMSGRERDKFESSIMKVVGEGKNAKAQADYTNMRAKLIAMTAVDEEGNLLFTERDVEQIGQKSGKALDRLFAAAQRLSGITDTDVEDMTKNSPAGQSGSSTSD